MRFEGPITAGCVEQLPTPPQSTFVSDELRRIAALARGFCPPDTEISFSFDSRLQIHFDIRSLDDVTRVEVMLDVRGSHLFADIQRRPNRSPRFFHRLSARVLR